MKPREIENKTTDYLVRINGTLWTSKITMIAALIIAIIGIPVAQSVLMYATYLVIDFIFMVLLINVDSKKRKKIEQEFTEFAAKNCETAGLDDQTAELLTRLASEKERVRDVIADIAGKISDKDR